MRSVTIHSLVFVGQATPCEAGQFSPVLEFGCQTCVSGYFSLPGAKECSVCPPGQYTSGPGQSTCSPCPAGYACPGLKPLDKWLFVIAGCRCTNAGFLILPEGYETAEKCGEKCLDINQEDPPADSKCVSFFLWSSKKVNGKTYNGVCEIASCSFGLRPDRVLNMGGTFPTNPPMAYPQEDLTNCPDNSVWRYPTIEASYELPGTCVLCLGWMPFGEVDRVALCRYAGGR